MSGAVDLLLSSASRGELHHAVILHGPNSEELRARAVAVAKALNCTNGSTGDNCLACQHTERSIHPDLHIIEVAGDKKLISVDQIRDLVSAATMRPYEGKTKVFIVDPADALSANGSNSLLKTLEEPSRDTNFLLLTRSPDLLLPTIRSRSQAIYVGGEPVVDRELQKSIRASLTSWAEQRDGTILLALAATIAQQDHVADAISLLTAALCEAAAGRLGGEPDPARYLAAADGTLAAIRALAVNADARLVVEQALAQLVVSRS